MIITEAEKIVLQKFGISIASSAPLKLIGCDKGEATGRFAHQVVSSNLTRIAENWAHYIAGLSEQGEIITPLQEFLEMNSLEYTHFLKYGRLLSQQSVGRIIRRIASTDDPVFWEYCQILSGDSL